MRHLEQTIDLMAMRISELENRIEKLERESYFNTRLSEPVEVVGSWMTKGNGQQQTIAVGNTKGLEVI